MHSYLLQCGKKENSVTAAQANTGCAHSSNAHKSLCSQCPSRIWDPLVSLALSVPHSCTLSNLRVVVYFLMKVCCGKKADSQAKNSFHPVPGILIINKCTGLKVYACESI